MPHYTTDPAPAPPLTVMPEIFNQTPITHETEFEVEKACHLIRSDPSVDVTLRDHIIGAILHMGGLPDPLHLARSIIGIHKASDSGSVQAFVEMFVAGIKFLRVADEHSSVYEDDDSAENGPLIYDDDDSFEDSLEGSSLRNFCRSCFANIIFSADLESSAGSCLKLEHRNRSSGDGPMCEVSGHHGPGAYLVDATIFPCTLNDTGCCQVRQQHLWDLLCCFWKAPIVNKIIDQCGERDVSSEMKHFTNGIIMSSACRQAFKRLKFYLLPIPETFSATRYEVEFHWVHKPLMSAQPNYRLSPEITEDYYLRYPPFDTGDRITFTTTDPRKYPLPDPGLLFARSLLARISLPMEPNLIHNQRILGHEYLDHVETDTDSEGYSDSDSFITTNTSGVETWVDGVPVWDGRDPLH